MSRMIGYDPQRVAELGFAGRSRGGFSAFGGVTVDALIAQLLGPAGPTPQLGRPRRRVLARLGGHCGRTPGVPPGEPSVADVGGGDDGWEVVGYESGVERFERELNAFERFLGGAAGTTGLVGRLPPNSGLGHIVVSPGAPPYFSEEPATLPSVDPPWSADVPDQADSSTGAVVTGALDLGVMVGQGAVLAANLDNGSERAYQVIVEEHEDDQLRATVRRYRTDRPAPRRRPRNIGQRADHLPVEQRPAGVPVSRGVPRTVAVAVLVLMVAGCRRGEDADPAEWCDAFVAGATFFDELADDPETYDEAALATREAKIREFHELPVPRAIRGEFRRIVEWFDTPAWERDNDQYFRDSIAFMTWVLDNCELPPELEDETRTDLEERLQRQAER